MMDEDGALEIRDEDGTVEITMKRYEEERRRGRFSRKIYTVEFLNQVIEITYSSAESTISQWIRGVHRLHRGGIPLIAGVSICRWDSNSLFHPAKGPSKDNLPIVLICVCIGGSHCLVSKIEYYLYRDAVKCESFPHALRNLLADHHITFVGVGIKKIAEQLESVWGVHVSSPTELRPLVEKAFGKETMSPGLKGLEEMARVALGGGVKVSKRPNNVASNILRQYLPDLDELMFATRDAFLACRIGESGLERIKAST